MSDALASPALSSRDRGLVNELVYGVLRTRRLLDRLLGKMVRRQPSSMLQIALQLGLYQILFLARIPDFAAADEMVGIVKRRVGKQQGGFLNAILRRAVREKDELLVSVEEFRNSEPDVAYSCPAWLYKRWRSRLSESDLLCLLKWQSEIPRVFARLNRLRSSESELERQAQGENLGLEPVSLGWESSAAVYRIGTPSGMTRHDSFRNGAFYVQDPSTLLSVDLLDPQPGEKVLDLCAAPGGKTSFIAEKMENTGEIIACDSVAARLDLVLENCTRLGISNVSAQLIEDASLPPGCGSNCDRVLVDVPCSNTGVLRRRVDLRWRLRESEIRNLAQTQASLIRLASQAVKPGGKLVYSTCSLEPEENNAIVVDFLKTNPQFKLEAERQLTPYGDGCDGAYVALLSREPS